VKACKPSNFLSLNLFSNSSESATWYLILIFVQFVLQCVTTQDFDQKQVSVIKVGILHRYKFWKICKKYLRELTQCLSAFWSRFWNAMSVIFVLVFGSHACKTNELIVHFSYPSSTTWHWSKDIYWSIKLSRSRGGIERFREWNSSQIFNIGTSDWRRLELAFVFNCCLFLYQLYFLQFS
jgi:hypothetical protein